MIIEGDKKVNCFHAILPLCTACKALCKTRGSYFSELLLNLWRNTDTMAIFDFFGNTEHKVFDYKPIYYDKEADERRQKFGAVDGRLEKEEGGYSVVFKDYRVRLSDEKARRLTVSDEAELDNSIVIAKYPKAEEIVYGTGIVKNLVMCLL